MKDLGRAAMAAAALNAGVESKAMAEDRPESGLLEDSEYYERADEATQEFLKKVDSGEYRLVPDRTPPHVEYEPGVLEAMKAQDLRVTPEGKLLNASGDGIDWSVLVMDRNNFVVSETESVKITMDGEAVVVTLWNSDNSRDVTRFENGEPVSVEHKVLKHDVEELESTQGYRQAAPDIKEIQERVFRGEYTMDNDKTPVTVELTDELRDTLNRHNLHLNKKGTRIEPNVPGEGDTLSWEAVYVDRSTKQVVLETRSVNIHEEGRTLAVDITYSDGSTDKVRFENGRIENKAHTQGW